ncbi:MAG: PA0069 family radical SAM protein [Labilithrix sp.]|nr:PA0069 family radical SAM protein [Labilithrix sp.]MCW5817498.1 PA0069 family radical SAM protein [Labilithrix sp.]
MWRLLQRSCWTLNVRSVIVVGVARHLPVSNPQNRFESIQLEYDEGEAPDAELEVYEDQSKSILATNDSPDVGFRWSVNPYRGCQHACSYCYARPSHEYLSLGAGTDFSRKIVVKKRAAELLREAFDKRSWKGELIVFSGITDCYQPLESKLRITRACLDVCAEYRNPVGIITKSPVIERDVDVLQELARTARVRVSVSVPFWDAGVAKALEPTVTTPERRMKIVETLAKAGIPVGVSVSPIVPGLNDEHLGDVLERARDAGARHAFYVLLRLPGAVKDVFEKSLHEHLPLRAEKVLRRLREAHGGKVYDSSFGQRGRGSSVYTDAFRVLFERTAKRCGLHSVEMDQYEATATEGRATFRRPAPRTTKTGQTSFGF